MPKSFGGDSPAVKTADDHIWSWFDEPAHGRHENANNGRAPETTAVSTQAAHGDFAYPLGNAGIEQKNVNIMREVQLHAAQMRLREQRRGFGDDLQHQSLPSISLNGDGASAERAASVNAEPPLVRLEPLSLANQEAQATRLKDGDGLRTDKQEAATASGEQAGSGYRQLHEILNGDGVSVSWLRQAGLLDQFRSQQCHEHLSWSPDGTVNMALKTQAGHRWTILCRPDGTASQRISDQSGREMVRFSSSGKVIDNLQRERVQNTLSA